VVLVAESERTKAAAVDGTKAISTLEETVAEGREMDKAAVVTGAVA